MDLKEKLVSSFLAFENKGILDLDSSVHAIRTKAIQNFEKEGFPSKKDEEWKYTSLSKMISLHFNAPAEAKISGSILKGYAEDAVRLVRRRA